MQPQNQTDHIAILALMLVGVLVRRLDELRQLDEPTARRVHQLAESVRIHARHSGLTDLDILFDNIERKIGERANA